MKRGVPGRKRFKCLRCGFELSTDRSFPSENMGGKCLGDVKGRHCWTGY